MPDSDLGYMRIADSDTGELCGIVDVYQSFIITQRWAEPGEFSLSLPASTESITLLTIGRLIFAGGFCGIIERVELSQGEDGGNDMMSISGCELSGILAYRLTLPTDGQEYAEYTGVPGAIMAKIVADNCVSSPTSARNYPLMELAAVDMSGEIISWQTRYEVVSDVLTGIAEQNGLNWRVDFDGGRWAFIVTATADRSAGQSANVPVIFSPAYDNVSGQSYTHSVAGSANVAIAAGAGKGADRLVCWAGETNAAGLKRRERYLSISKYTVLGAEAEVQLNKYSPIQSLEGTVFSGGTYEYGVDYALGDVVTVQHPGWGVQMDARISEATRTYEGDTCTMEITLGDGALTLIDVMQRAIKPMSDETRR